MYLFLGMYMRIFLVFAAIVAFTEGAIPGTPRPGNVIRTRQPNPVLKQRNEII